jgi:hypothetical protein
MNSPQKSPQSIPSTKRWVPSGRFKEFVAILIVLVLFSRAVILFLPILFLIAVYWLVKGIFLLPRRARIPVSLALAIGVGSFGIVQFQAEQANQKLLQRLSQYDTVTIRRDGIFATSPITQFSAENNFNDRDLEALAELPELAGVTHIFLKRCDVTDRGLDKFDRCWKLEYLFVDSKDISNEAIASFVDRHPKCTVIPFRRN